MNCYVCDPYSGAVFPELVTKENTLFYPEEGMTTRQRHTTSKPKDFHIVTDCPDLVPLYRYDEVFVWKDGEWIKPSQETLGLSHNLVRKVIFGITSTIPLALLTGEVTNCMGKKL